MVVGGEERSPVVVDSWDDVDGVHTGEEESSMSLRGLSGLFESSSVIAHRVRR